MADHLDAPGLTSPAMDARVDITDHYAFQKPGDADRTVLILNVNPLAPTHADEFRSDAVYETLVPMLMQPDHLTQADQMGRPAINTVFNHGPDKNLFNLTQPADQRNAATTGGPSFLELFASELQTLGGYGASEAKSIAEILLPDILTFDYSSSGGFLNGRRLQDDVIDIEPNLVTKGGVSGDKVGPHSDYLSDFPYLGNPHNSSKRS